MSDQINFGTTEFIAYPKMEGEEYLRILTRGMEGGSEKRGSPDSMSNIHDQYPMIN